MGASHPDFGGRKLAREAQGSAWTNVQGVKCPAEIDPEMDTWTSLKIAYQAGCLVRWVP